MTTKPTPKPLSLDTCLVGNWDMSTPASVLNPDAGPLQQLSWLYSQTKEINDLLWGFIQLNNAAAEASMASPLCHFIEARTTVMVRLLEVMCAQEWRATPITKVGS